MMKSTLIIVSIWLQSFFYQKECFCSGKEFAGNDPSASHITKIIMPASTTNLGYIHPSNTGFLYARRDGNTIVTNTDTSLKKGQGKILFLGDGTDDTSSTSSTGRWVVGGIFIGILVGGFLITLIVLFVGNKRRIGSGRQPIYGTSWLTPPSYWQSQHYYSTNRGEEPTECVPTYTKQPNEDIDLGFYDERGDFHLSRKENEYTAPKSNDQHEGIGQVATNEDTLISSDSLEGGSSGGNSVTTAPLPAVTAGHSRDHTVVIQQDSPPADLGETKYH